MSACGKRVIAGHSRQMTGVVDRQNTNVAPVADLEAIDAAIRRDQPGRLFRPAVDRPEKVQREKTNCSGV